MRTGPGAVRRSIQVVRWSPRRRARGSGRRRAREQRRPTLTPEQDCVVTGPGADGCTGASDGHPVVSRARDRFHVAVEAYLVPRVDDLVVAGARAEAVPQLPPPGPTMTSLPPRVMMTSSLVWRGFGRHPECRRGWVPRRSTSPLVARSALTSLAASAQGGAGSDALLEARFGAGSDVAPPARLGLGRWGAGRASHQRQDRTASRRTQVSSRPRSSPFIPEGLTRWAPSHLRDHSRRAPSLIRRSRGPPWVTCRNVRLRSAHIRRASHRE